MVSVVVAASVMVAPATVVSALNVVMAKGTADSVVTEAAPKFNVPLVKLMVPLLLKLPLIVPKETPETLPVEVTVTLLNVEAPAPEITVVPAKVAVPAVCNSVPVNTRFPRII